MGSTGRRRGLARGILLSWLFVSLGCGDGPLDDPEIEPDRSWRATESFVWARWQSHRVRARQLARLVASDPAAVSASRIRYVERQYRQFLLSRGLTAAVRDALRREAQAKADEWMRTPLCRFDPHAVHFVGFHGLGPVSLSPLDGRPTVAAFIARTKGVVILRLIVGPEGTVGAVKVLKGLSAGLTQEAVRLARRSRFLPALRCGKSATVAYVVAIDFPLPPARPE